MILKKLKLTKVSLGLLTSLFAVLAIGNVVVGGYLERQTFKLQEKNKNLLEELFAKSLSLLADRNYREASNALADLDKKIDEENSKLASSFKIPVSVLQQNSPPAAGT